MPGAAVKPPDRNCRSRADARLPSARASAIPAIAVRAGFALKWLGSALILVEFARRYRLAGLCDESVGVLLGLANEVLDVAAKPVEIEFEAGAGGFCGRRRVGHHTRGQGKPEQQRRKHFIADLFVLGECEDVLKQDLREPVEVVEGFIPVFVENIVLFVGHSYPIVLVGIGAGGGTRTHTTLPSRDFKSLASTSSATSALVARSEA